MRAFVLVTLLGVSLWGVVFSHTTSTGQKSMTSWIEIKNRDLVRQKWDYSCGSASLATIFNYYYEHNMSEQSIVAQVAQNKQIKVETLEDYYKHKDTGLSFFDLSLIAQAQGYKALGLAIAMDMLAKLQMPVILYVKIRNQEHFTVFKGMDSRHVYLADPSFGNIKVTHGRFRAMFTQREGELAGKLLAILPTDASQKGSREFLLRGEQPNTESLALIRARLFR